MKENEYTTEQIVEKIRKIQAHRVSADKIGNKEEAKAFAKMLSKLLDQYNLSMTDIEFEQHREREEIDYTRIRWSEHGGKDSRKRCSWIEDLARVITEHFGCSYLIVPGFNGISIVGRGAGRSLSQKALINLVLACEILSEKAYNAYYNICYAEGRTQDARGYSASWRAGFVRGVRIQLVLEREAREAAANRNALVRVTTELADVHNYIEERYKNKKADCIGGSSVLNMAGYREGKERGQVQNIQGDDELSQS